MADAAGPKTGICDLDLRGFQAARSSSFLARASMSSRASWWVLCARRAVMPCTKSKMLSGCAAFLLRTVSMIFAVSAFEKPRLRRNSLRSSSARATMLRARRLDAVDERHGRGIGETDQRWPRFMGETRGGIFRVTNGDLLEILDAP